MDLIYTNHQNGKRRIHVEIDEGEVADLLDDLKPLDHDAFAATHRFIAVLEDANAVFATDQRNDAHEAEISRT